MCHTGSALKCSDDDPIELLLCVALCNTDKTSQRMQTSEDIERLA